MRLNRRQPAEQHVEELFGRHRARQDVGPQLRDVAPILGRAICCRLEDYWRALSQRVELLGSHNPGANGLAQLKQRTSCRFR
ncbi:hypothetical protein D3C86_1032780 [compost metagenome]